MESEKIRVLNELCMDYATNYIIEDDGTILLTLEVYPRVVQQCITPQEIAQLPLNVFSDILRMKITAMEDSIRRD